MGEHQTAAMDRNELNALPFRVRAAISDMCAEARREVQGGRLFGIPVDMQDPDMVLAAVWAYSKLQNPSSKW